VVILVSLGHTTTVELQEAAEAVTRGGAKLAGIVLDTPQKHGLRRSKQHETTVDEAEVPVPATPEPVPATPAVTPTATPAAEGLVPAPVSKAKRAVPAVDARTEEIPKIDAPLNGATNGHVNGLAKNGSSTNGANGHLTSATPIGPKLPADSSEVPPTPAPTPWFTEVEGDSDKDDDSDFAPSRRMM
jgi:hypothetical protein